MAETLHERIDRLLHDAEHKDGAVEFCRTLMPDPVRERRFRAERDNLINEALALDPHRTAPAWHETSLRIAPPAASPAERTGGGNG